VSARRLAAAVAAALALGGAQSGVASVRVDTSHAAAHRRDADACVVRAVVIYTDPYIGGRLSHAEIVAAIARMCAAPLRIHAEDLGLAAPAAERLAQNLIAAGLRGQLPAETGWPPLQNAR
jgi:hypothetical protein